MCRGMGNREVARRLKKVNLHNIAQKGDPSKCTNYRTISLIASKVLLRVILNRIELKTEEELAVEQAGFRNNRGTRNHITNICIMMQKARKHKEPLFLGCIDFVRAFDMIIHDKM